MKLETVKIAFLFLLILFIPFVSFAHPGGLDDQGGHFDRKTNTYHCHEEPCFSIHKQVEEAHEEAEPGTFISVYSREDWPHWIDEDGDCQNTRQELLIAASLVPVQFTNANHCTVNWQMAWRVYRKDIY